MIPRLDLGGSTLWAVPAVHHQMGFAGAVHDALHDPATRPEAVAVELGQGAVDAVAQWMLELGVAGPAVVPLPCMLGLVRKNRRIHPRHRATALRLQEVHGKPIEQLPASVLREHLGHAGIGLLCLSATDSIIEAIRSAVELSLPVYGIDLEDCAAVDREGPPIEDPTGAGEDPERWARRNAAAAAKGRDPWVDGRRELFMAAHLRRLLGQHRSVLFTGGLGHWEPLGASLRNDERPVAADAPRGWTGEYRRVLVDPAIAVRHMDRFPDLTWRYEEQRARAAGGRIGRIATGDLMAEKIAVACACAAPDERERLAGFAHYLANLAVIGLRAGLEFASLLNAADTMVSRVFALRLGEALLKDGLSWATHEQFPQLPQLIASPPTPDELGFAGCGEKAEWVQDGRRSRPFFLGGERRGDVPPLTVPLQAMTSPVPPVGAPGPCTSANWVWPPCESRFFGTCYAAAAIAWENERNRIVEPFAGSLLDGVDIKATLRAHARGQGRVQVRDSRQRRRAVEQEELTEPVVCLFEARADVVGARWGHLRAGSGLDRYVRDPVRHREVREREGDYFISSVQVSERRTPEEHLQPWVGEVRYLWGSVAFGNPCINAQQGARWVEEGDYQRSPILRGGGIEELCHYYRSRFEVHLDLADWRTALVRIAIPFARRRVVVVAPDSFIASNELVQEAAARRVALAMVPLSTFPAECIAAIRRQYFVTPCDNDGIEFPEQLSAVLGERADAHFGELPSWIRAQTRPAPVPPRPGSVT